MVRRKTALAALLALLAAPAAAHVTIDPPQAAAGSYLRDDFAPLRIMGKVKLVQGDYEVVPGVWIRATGGHVRHHQCVEIKSGGRTAYFWADLMPTTAHIKPAWTMRFSPRRVF